MCTQFKDIISHSQEITSAVASNKMKAVIIFTLVAWSQAAKLEKAYLPPSARAQSAGGSPNFLQTPISGPSAPTAFGEAGNGFPDNFAPTANDFAPSGASFIEPGNAGNGYAKPGNGYAQSGNVYAQSGNRFSQSGNRYAQSGNGYPQSNNGFKSFESRPERVQAAFERNAAILRQSSENNVDSYAYAFETENGIRAEENGVATHGVEAQGGFSYTGDDGKVYSVRYTADQNGFVPQGDHLPTPPPIPEEILKALEQNAREEAAGIYDDGSYKEANYAEGNGYPSYGGSQNGNDEDSVVTNNALLRSLPESQGPSFGDQVEKAYLPPFAGSQNGFGRRSSYNARDGYRY